MAISNRQNLETVSERILVVDDEPDIRSTLSEFLELIGYGVAVASSAAEALNALRHDRFDLVITDVRMPGMSGIEAIPLIKEIDAEVAIIVITGYDSIDGAVEAIHRGAYDHVAKPFNFTDIEVIIKRALIKRRLICHEDFSGKIVGESAPMKKLKGFIARVAPLESTVLVTGESGTGKELVSDMIHSQSRRAAGAFVKINCAAIPESLLESELFGFEKGAFTGANTQRRGKFESAHKGTILLDEIGEMPLNVQAKLLRVVEQKQVEKLGGNNSVSVDVRVIAATNQDLEDQIRRQQFRRDLYYRLNVVSLKLPPLRERTGDIPLLVRHFLGKISLKLGIDLLDITKEAIDILFSHDWPGNVRELANMLEKAAIFRNGDIIDVPDILMSLQKSSGIPLSKDQALDDQAILDGTSISLMETMRNVEKTLIVRALSKTEGVQSEAAKMLGVSSKNLWKKIQKHSIEPQNFGVMAAHF